MKPAERWYLTLLGLTTGGPLGAFLCPTAWKQFKGNPWPWLLAGIIAGPFSWGLAQG